MFKILVVDDNKDNVQLLSADLLDEGYEVVEAYNTNCLATYWPRTKGERKTMPIIRIKNSKLRIEVVDVDDKGKEELICGLDCKPKYDDPDYEIITGKEHGQGPKGRIYKQVGGVIETEIR